MKPVLTLHSPAGQRARLAVLVFHRVLPVPDPLCPDEMHAVRFDALCAWLARTFNVLPLDQAVRALHQGTLAARALAISFDDGYADNHDIALPILQRHGLPATFFVATGYLDGGRMFNDTVIEAVRRAPGPQLDLRAPETGALGLLPLADWRARRDAVARILGGIKYLPPGERPQVARSIAGATGATLPDDLMMSSDQVRALHDAGMTVGAHTVSHPILATLDEAAQFDEIVQGRQRLEQITGAPVALFAYPNGKPGIDYDARSVAAVRCAGFEAAVSTAWGAAHRGTDPFQIPRFTPWSDSPPRFAAHMLRNYWRTPEPAA
jgi:peptidoglycan/xylan/chitin deacetylase (PgdA/CDA1 family)